MKFQKTLGIKLLALAFLCFLLFTAYLYGRRWGNIDAYHIGFQQGYESGMSDAAMAFESGGLIDAKTGKVLKKP